jgi:hypothetical protein
LIANFQRWNIPVLQLGVGRMEETRSRVIEVGQCMRNIFNTISGQDQTTPKMNQTEVSMSVNTASNMSPGESMLADQQDSQNSQSKPIQMNIQ